MDWSIIIFVSSTGLAMIGLIIREWAKINRELADKLTEEETRTLIADQVEPIRDDLYEIKMQLDKIIDRLLDAR